MKKSFTPAMEGFLILSMQRKTSVAYKDPDLLIAKIVSHILRVRKSQIKYSYQPADIIVFDETPVWADMVSNTTVDVVEKKQYENNRTRKMPQQLGWLQKVME